MLVNSYGDLAHHMFLRNRNAELRQNVDTLAQELATGKTADITSKLGGDFTYLSDVENDITRLDGYMVATNEMVLFSASMQNSLGRVQGNVQDMRDDVLGLSTTMNAGDAKQFAQRGRVELDNAIGALNGWAGGRSLFAGTATDTSPLNSVDLLMTELVSEVAGLTTSADITQAIKDWFDDPTGFDAAMYVGSTTDLSPVIVSENETVSIGIRADNDDLKHALQSFAIAAISEEPGVTISDDVKVELAKISGSELAGSNDKLISIQAEVGFIEGQLVRVDTRNEASKTALSIAKNDLVAADPYETYTLYQEASLQLETLYNVTARSSELSLLRYMR